MLFTPFDIGLPLGPFPPMDASLLMTRPNHNNSALLAFPILPLHSIVYYVELDQIIFPETWKAKYIVCRIYRWAAVVSRGWAKDSACRLQVSLSCPVLCQIVSLQYLSTSSLHRLAGLPCLFLSYGLQVVTREFHRSSLIVNYINDFCPLPGPGVGLSILVRDIEHTSFDFGMYARSLFCDCFICHSWQHKGVVHMSLQADDKVAFVIYCLCFSTSCRSTNVISVIPYSNLFSSFDTRAWFFVWCSP